MNPLYLDARAEAQARGARARRAELQGALRALRLPPRGPRRPVPRRARLDRAAVRGRRRPALPRRASASRSTRPSAGTSRASSARRSGTRRSRPTRCCRRSRARSPTSASTCARSRTSSSTSSSATKKTPRAFCAPIEIPDRVVLVIQPIGGADDWRALFHEAGHTEHFAQHLAATCRWRSKRLGDNAVTEGWAMLLQHLTDEPALARAAARHAAAGRVRDRGRDRAPLLRPPLRGEAAVRDRVPRRGRRRPRCGRATSSCSPTR